ncbi:MAG: diacylglycerol kinase family protein [Planctomycetota bacterium]
MRVALLVNSIAGRGRGPRLASLLRTALVAEGMTVKTPESNVSDAVDDLSHADIAVVVGGDGTLNRWLPSLLAPGAPPVWHAPTGTENLFARTHGSDRSAGSLVAAILAGRTSRQDVGMVNGRPFAIMASLGPDAAIVNAVNANRTGRISRASYAAPVLQALAMGTTSHATVTIDGGPGISCRGMLVVANMPMYGARLDPAWESRPDDGRLTVVHLPGAIAATIGLRLAACWTRNERLIPGRRVWQASRVSIEPRAGTPHQIDGDPAPPAIVSAGRLDFGVLPGALAVLLPAQPKVDAPATQTRSTRFAPNENATSR